MTTKSLIACQACIQPEPATYEYVGKAIDIKFVCDRHAMQLRNSGADRDPDHWHRLEDI